MLARLVANAAALLVAALIVPGIHLNHADGLANQIVTALIVALIFGVVNSLVKPIVSILSLPAIVLTLGLFLLVVNTLMLMLTSTISVNLGLGFAVDSWGAAFLGSIVVSIVSAVVSGVLGSNK